MLFNKKILNEQNILECEHLRYSYENKGLFDFDFSLVIKKNDFIGIIGDSGCGKSTFFSLIAGLLTPQGGTLKINGKNILNDHPSERDCSIFFQSHNLFPHLSVYQNIAIGKSPKLKLIKEEKQRLFELLQALDIEKIVNKYAKDLSGGEMQRVALARCIFRNKSLLLLDEPFSSVDPEMRIKGYKLLYEQAKLRNLTVLLISHFPYEIHSFVDGFVKIHQGKIQKITKNEVLKSFVSSVN